MQQDDNTGAEVIEASVIDVTEVAARPRAARRGVVLDFRGPTENGPATRATRGDDPVVAVPQPVAVRPEPPARPLAGRVALVTGGSGGIGRAVALRLVALGARVCVLGRDVAGLRETVDLAGPSATILYLPCDVGSVSEIEEVVDFVERFGRPVDVLVHADGVQVRGGVERGSVNDLDEQYLVNVRGCYVLSQRLFPRLREGGGDVVVLNSTPSAPHAEFAQHTVVSHALLALADALRSELDGSGVRVTSVLAEAGAEDTVDDADLADAIVGALTVSPAVEVTDLRLRRRRPPVAS